MKLECSKCGKHIVPIALQGGGTVWCEPQAVTYWAVEENPEGEIFTPNGERHSCVFTGELEKATGIGFVAHRCETGTEGESADEAKTDEAVS